MGEVTGPKKLRSMDFKVNVLDSGELEAVFGFTVVFDPEDLKEMTQEKVAEFFESFGKMLGLEVTK